MSVASQAPDPPKDPASALVEALAVLHRPQDRVAQPIDARIGVGPGMDEPLLVELPDELSNLVQLE